MRDDDKVVRAIALWLVAVGVKDDGVFPRARDIADALEPLLFATGPRTGGGG